MTDQVFIVLRTLGDVPEPVGAWFDHAEAARIARDLGAGHFVAPVPMVPPGVGLVAQVFRCRAVVRDGEVSVPEDPAPLLGAARLVLGSADMPGERVVVDEQAAALEAAVHGRPVFFVEAFAVTGDRARELAVGRAEALARGDS